MLQRLFFWLFVRPVVAFFIGMRVRGRELLPAQDPFLLVANHTSHLDTAVILSLFRTRRLARIRPVAAADYWERDRFTKWFARTFINILAIARRREEGTEDPRDQMSEALREGNSLVLFPEGTRGRGDQMAPFKSGVSDVILANPDVPVVPVGLINLGRSLPKGSFFPLPLFCEVRVGPPLHPTGSREEVLAQVESAVRSLVEET